MLKTIINKDSLNSEELSADLIQSLPNSKKIYVQSKRFKDVKVGMRQISINNRQSSITVYDTSGPYTDSNYSKDITLGIRKIRKKWIENRLNIQKESKVKLKYLNPKNNKGKKFPLKNKTIFKSAPNREITQMYLAKSGQITEEME